ncbi:MAG: nucleotidyltransferase family protein [Parasphingorhabdus sp.]|uniref:nucleotidyltransferase family protein n=1 Tax=Parasphingorhabdus sp. TaxID=2709688 RepID=UPI003296DA95
MIAAAKDRIILALLAAGESRRFGQEDKLSAKLHGKMLGVHAAGRLADLPFGQCIVIAGQSDHPCARQWQDLGYEIIVNDAAEHGQSSSVRRAAHYAQTHHATGLCICLADMPYIDARHVQRLYDDFNRLGQQDIIASAAQNGPIPPAIFPADRLEALQNLSGDHGARKLLDQAHKVAGNSDQFIDIDTPAQLARENQKTTLN